MAETTITINGEARGSFWWPIGEPWTVPVWRTLRVDRETPSIRAAVLRILQEHEGDSSDAVMLSPDSLVSIRRTRWDGRTERSSSRIYTADELPSIRDMVAE